MRCTNATEKIAKTIREKNIDAIVLYSVPTNGLQTLRLAKKFNIPVIFRSIDILNQLVARGFFTLLGTLGMAAW